MRWLGRTSTPPPSTLLCKRKWIVLGERELLSSYSFLEKIFFNDRIGLCVCVCCFLLEVVAERTLRLLRSQGFVTSRNKGRRERGIFFTFYYYDYYSSCVNNGLQHQAIEFRFIFLFLSISLSRALLLCITLTNSPFVHGGKLCSLSAGGLVFVNKAKHTHTHGELWRRGTDCG